MKISIRMFELLLFCACLPGLVGIAFGFFTKGK